MKSYRILFLIMNVLLIFNISILSAYGFNPTQEASYQNPLIRQGIDLYKSGEYDKAMRILKEVINISVDNNELFIAYLYLGYTYFTIGQLENAIPNIDEAIKINPNSQLDRDEFVSEFIDFFNDAKQMIVGIGFFESIPAGAILYIDKNKIGITPAKIELLAGTYWLRLVKWGVCTL